MRELEAKEKYCPFTLNNPSFNGELDYCVATRCMAWQKTQEGIGHCKLINQGERL